MSTEEEIRTIFRKVRNRNKLPSITCDHATGNEFKPTELVFLNILGVNVVIGACNEKCLFLTMKKYMDLNLVTCLWCKTKITAKDSYSTATMEEKGYLYCSDKCVKAGYPTVVPNVLICQHLDLM